jgi:copper chaperone
MINKSEYTVQGMTCSSCATKVSGAVEALPGVVDTDVDVATGTLTVTGDIDDATVHDAITKAGYRVA